LLLIILLLLLFLFMPSQVEYDELEAPDMPAPDYEEDDYPEWDLPQRPEDDRAESAQHDADAESNAEETQATSTLAQRRAAGVRESPLVSGSGTDGQLGELESVTDSVKDRVGDKSDIEDESDDDESVARRRSEAQADQTHEQRRWHSRTANMMKLLQRELPGDEDTVSYQSLAENRRRRTVAGCFFEVLQLKTWGRIDVQQDEAYGEITIKQGPKFANAIPATTSG
jgi:chromatin segregation and condensation protein Rec8/ScpA/Scc1 (kleisin family)